LPHRSAQRQLHTTPADLSLGNPVLARRNAVTAIAAIDPDKLADGFAGVKKHNDEQVRMTAYQALYLKIGKKGVVSTLPATLAVPHLIDATKDGSANIRLLTVQGLSGYGTAAKDAVPALTALLNDADARVHQQAQAVLDQIKGK